jgi:hypothetical protein
MRVWRAYKAGVFVSDDDKEKERAKRARRTYHPLEVPSTDVPDASTSSHPLMGEALCARIRATEAALHTRNTLDVDEWPSSNGGDTIEGEVEEEDGSTMAWQEDFLWNLGDELATKGHTYDELRDLINLIAVDYDHQFEPLADVPIQEFSPVEY